MPRLTRATLALAVVISLPAVASAATTAVHCAPGDQSVVVDTTMKTYAVIKIAHAVPVTRAQRHAMSSQKTSASRCRRWPACRPRLYEVSPTLACFKALIS